jgi:hypothetical protein
MKVYYMTLMQNQDIVLQSKSYKQNNRGRRRSRSIEEVGPLTNFLCSDLFWVLRMVILISVPNQMVPGSRLQKNLNRFFCETSLLTASSHGEIHPLSSWFDTKSTKAWWIWCQITTCSPSLLSLFHFPPLRGLAHFKFWCSSSSWNIWNLLMIWNQNACTPFLRMRDND